MVTLSENRAADVADFTFRTLAGEHEWRVVGFTGSEALNEPYRSRLELRTNAAIQPGEQLGQPCCLRIDGPAGGREIHGIIARFEHLGEVRGSSVYAAEIVPPLWLLSKRQRSRIFQQHNCPDMSFPGIVRRVLESAGIPDYRFEFRLSGEHAQHEYVVQDRESELGFRAGR